jgi:hypothetical protein
MRKMPPPIDANSNVPSNATRACGPNDAALYRLEVLDLVLTRVDVESGAIAQHATVVWVAHLDGVDACGHGEQVIAVLVRHDGVRAEHRPQE